MADVREWTAADDERLRAAMATLRADVDAAPLADVRFVKARGVRRRRQRMLAWTAAGAAAAVVASVVAFNPLGRESSAPVVPAETSTTAPTPTATDDPLAQPGALPLAQEWAKALTLEGPVRVTPVQPFEADECVAVEPGTKVQQEQVATDTIEGGQTRFTIGAGSDPQTAAEGLADGVAGCQAGPGFSVTPVQADSWPRLYSYTAGEAGSGWFAIALVENDIALLRVADPRTGPSAFTRQQVGALAEVAAARLGRYGSGATASPAPTTTQPTPNVPFTRAIDQQMPVVGVEPLLPSKLFVAASQWTSPAFANGAKAYAVPGAQEGSSAIVQCETDQQQAGIGGRYGIVSIRAGSGDANYIGKQRVRLFEDVQGYELVQADMARLDKLVMAGCTTADGANRTTAERGPVQGTYLLTTRVTAEATGPMYQWVGVTGQQTEGAISTIVFHGTDDGQGFTGSKEQGFEELLRLMDLARQK